ncbi:MAG: hypothetical protein ACI9R3_001485 [Verrucomicrobiales bacterium]|jgi:hypothetical protein
MIIGALVAVGIGLIRAGEASDSIKDEVVEIVADPASIALTRPGERFCILVHGITESGRQIDLTREAEYVTPASPDVIGITPNGVVSGRSDGACGVIVRARGMERSINVRVANCHVPRKFHFETDIAPLFSRFGCNSSGCHGKAEGQNGFKLSVFGYDAQGDFEALTHAARGRRLSPSTPDNSLLLLKATGLLPHGGGERMVAGSLGYETLREWIGSGAPFGEEADHAKIERLEISPSERVMSFRSMQQLRVVAVFSDGRRSDVTHLSEFQSNNDALAQIDEDGLISAGELPGQSAVMARYLGATEICRLLVPRPGETTETPFPPAHGFIDEAVYANLKKLNLRPSDLADDATFLRRAYLDIIGTLPTAAEAQEFLGNQDPGRRAQLVDALLERPEYADYWALKWADLLRVDSEKLGRRGAYDYYRWIRESLLENKPFDVLCRELVTAEGPLTESPAGHFFKVVSRPGDMASSLSQVFLGVRIACAECHHHPYDRWSEDDYYGMQAFFQPVAPRKAGAEEIILAVGNPSAKNPRTNKDIHAYPLGGIAPEKASAESGDQRKALAVWLTAPDNPWFARNLTNRMAAHFFGRGLVEPVDDVRATNPPSNPELYDALARHATEVKFDLKEIIRTLTASRTYQLSSHPNETNEIDEQNYSRSLFKPITAEVLLDAVCQTTGIEEKFDSMPAGYRAIQLWDSQVPHYFLRLYGRPMRASACECERNGEASIAQVLHLMNSPQINAKLAHESGTMARLARTLSDEGQLVDQLYLTFFARPPNDGERSRACRYLENAGTEKRREATEDLAWSMMNSLEFVFNH